jgi:hypothetical protein
MNKIIKYLESIRLSPLQSTHDLQQELDAVRKAHAAVSADLAALRANLQSAREGDTQRLVDLQQQMRHIESERNNACQQVEHLEHVLADAEQRQKSTEADVSSLGAELERERTDARLQVEHLERALADAEQRQKSTETDVSLLGAKLEEERSNARVQIENLEHALTEAEQCQKSTEAHVGLLESRIEEERRIARKQVEQLERTLADAEQRQKSTEVHVGSLEAMLREERDAHAAGIHATETFLGRMQSEQEAHAKLQSELADALQDVTLRLQGTLQLQNNKPQSSLLKLLVMAVILFLTGTLAGRYTLQGRQDGGRQPAVAERELHDMREYLQQHIDNQDAMLNELALAMNRRTVEEHAPVVERPAEPGAGTQAADTQQQNTVAFEPDISELQAGLITLGFDLGISKPNGEAGIKTRQALQEFRQFYLPHDEAQDDAVSEQLAAQILKSADRTRADAARFPIGNDVLAAIRLGSIRTGVDFSFLMELARVESNFNPAARAPRSTATGLFQFRDGAWLEAIHTFGAEYGLQAYAASVETVNDEEHGQQSIVRDPQQLEVLALRLNPRLSALMAAENIKRNFRILSHKTGHEPDRTELYLAHYLGPDGAVKFLKKLDEEPAAIAGELFPEEAASDPGVFLSGHGQPRTVAGVYRWLDSRFNTARYD